MDAVFRGKTSLDTSGMRDGFDRLRSMNRKTAKEMQETAAQTRMAFSGRDTIGITAKAHNQVSPLAKDQAFRVKADVSGVQKANRELRITTSRTARLHNALVRLEFAGRNAFAALRYQAKRFTRDVTAPALEASAAMTTFARRAALAGTALSTLGVSRVFKFEGMEQQFATLIGDSEKARKTIRNLLDESAKTPFSADNYAAAYKTLLTTANGELATGDNMQRIGNAAAVMGKTIEEVAGQVSYLYAMLKAGKGGGVAARQLLKDSIITLDTYKLLDKEGKNAENFGKVWSRVVADLNSFSGGMERVSRTGSGALKVLRNLADTALQETFAALADSVKDVVFNLSEMLRAARASGQIAEVGKTIGAAFRDIVDGIYRAIQAFRQMDETSRAALGNMIVGFGTVAVAWRVGVLVPILKASVGLVAFLVPLFAKMTSSIVANFGVISKGIALVGTAIAGFKIGNEIFESLSGIGNQIIETVSTVLETVVKMFDGFLQSFWKPWTTAISELIKGNFKEAAAAMPGEFINAWKNIAQDAKNGMQQIDAIWKSPAGRAQSGQEAAGKGAISTLDDLQKRIKGIVEETQSELGKIFGGDWKKFMPKGISEFFDKFKELGNIKMPEMPKPPDLTGARKNAEAIAEANRQANAYTIRGYYFRKLDMNAIMAAAKNNGKMAEHNRKRELDAQKKAQSKQTLKPIETEFQRSNRLLEDIKRNTGKNSGAVYA